jgi:hydroxyacylglutathione hydrolase
LKLLDTLYFYPWESMAENNCNSYLIDGEVPILIDPGHHHLFQNLRQAMAADGFHREDIKLIVVTHAHPDHFEAIQDFLDLKTRIALHPEFEKFIRSTANTSSAFWAGICRPKGWISI